MPSLKQLAYPLILSYSIFVSYKVSIPLEENITNYLSQYPTQLDSFAKNTNYDPRREHVLNNWLICGLFAYLSMGFFCLGLDMILPITYKTQGNRSYFTFREVLDASSLGVFNIACCGWVLVLPYVNLFTFEQRNPIALTDEINVPLEIVKFIGCAIIVDIWFYFTHRAFHHPIFYGKLKKFMLANLVRYAQRNTLLISI